MIYRRPAWSHEALARLLAAGPGERVAFAPVAISPAKLAETLTALANAHGGDVLLGVTSVGKVAGVTSADEARAAVQAAGLLSTPPLILPLPQIVESDGKPICLAEVPPGLPHVYSLGGRYLTRSASPSIANDRINADMHWRIEQVEIK